MTWQYSKQFLWISSHHIPGSDAKVTVPKLAPSTRVTKSKHLRMERRKESLLARGLTMEQVEATMQASKLRRMTKQKTLEDFIHVELPDNAKHRLEVSGNKIQWVISMIFLYCMPQNQRRKRGGKQAIPGTINLHNMASDGTKPYSPYAWQ